MTFNLQEEQLPPSQAIVSQSHIREKPVEPASNEQFLPYMRASSQLSSYAQQSHAPNGNSTGSFANTAAAAPNGYQTQITRASSQLRPEETYLSAAFETPFPDTFSPAFADVTHQASMQPPQPQRTDLSPAVPWQNTQDGLAELLPNHSLSQQPPTAPWQSSPSGPSAINRSRVHGHPSDASPVMKAALGGATRGRHELYRPQQPNQAQVSSFPFP